MRSHSAFSALFLIGLVALPATGGAQIIRDSTLPRPVSPPIATMPRPDGQPNRTLSAAERAALPPIDRAQLEQREFEMYRHTHLPMSLLSRTPNCDEHVGKYCYWYDENAKVPKEPDLIVKRREQMLKVLDSLAQIIPANNWLAEQRVRYLAESDRLHEALDVARRCGTGTGIGTDSGTGGWNCEILEGFALHLIGDYVAAGEVYDKALAKMDARQKCEWQNIAPLLDDVAIAQYRSLTCGSSARAAWEWRTWFLARTLYSMQGNDSRTEFFARMTMAQMFTNAPSAYQNGFDQDERELLIRFGWPRAWSGSMQLPFTIAMVPPSVGVPGGGGGGGGGGRGGGGGGGAGPNVGGAKGRGRGGTPVGSYPPGTKIPANVPPLVRPPDMPGTGGLPGGLGGAPDSRPPARPGRGIQLIPREGDGVNVTGIEAFPAYRYIPAGFVLGDPPQSDSAAWRLQLPPVMGRYAPPYAKALVPLEHQKAVFKRGDSAIVVMAYDTRGTKAVDGAKLRVGLVVTRAEELPREFVVVRDSAPASGVLTVRAPWAPLLMSAEAAAPERNAVARARYGVGPVRGPALRVVLSDLLFYKSYGSFPSSVEEVAPHALPTERVNPSEKLGVYWETYGTNPGGEKLKVSLIVAREDAQDEGGLFKRLGRSLRLSSARAPVSVGVDDISARGQTTSSRAIELDISTLTKGTYIVQLEIEVAGQPTLRAEHRIEVVAR